VTTLPDHATYGERHLHKLLRDLPRKQFFFHHEPRLHQDSGRSSKPDFVIVDALRGVIVLEVKDWVRLTGGDQRTIHTIRSTDKRAISYDNPVQTAEHYAYDLKRQFENRAELWQERRGRPMLRFPWQVMVALPRISQRTIASFESKSIWPRGVVLGKEQLQSADQIAQAIHALPWTFRLEQPLSRDLLDVIREVLDPSLIILDEDSQPLGTLTPPQHQLIVEPLRLGQPQQMTLFEYDVLPDDAHSAAGSDEAHIQLVRGVAGSGKTLVIVRRTQRLAAQYPQARFLVLTYNVELAQDLKARIGPHDNVHVTNFHRLCRRIIGTRWDDPLTARDWLRSQPKVLDTLQLKPEFIESEFAWRREMDLHANDRYLEADRKGRGQRLDRRQREQINVLFQAYRAHQQSQRAAGGAGFDWDEVGFLALDALGGRIPADDPLHPAAFDCILVDEAQDFAPSWMRLIMLLLKPGGSLFICDDPAQSLFCSYTWAQKGLNIMGRSRLLRVPFRSTREISQAAHSLIEADDTLRVNADRTEPDFDSYELGSGPLPALLTFADPEAEAHYIESRIHWLLDQNVPPHQIAILPPARWHLNRWTPWREHGLVVHHVEKLKGLEFRAVFMPQLQTAFPHPDDADAVTVTRRRLFTAMTRARYRLTMTYTGTLPTPLHPLLAYCWLETIDSSQV
jgi:hypothetical protein